jgi:uncharacterized protein YneF (UPF0154 family)
MQRLNGGEVRDLWDRHGAALLAFLASRYFNDGLENAQRIAEAALKFVYSNPVGQLPSGFRVQIAGDGQRRAWLFSVAAHLAVEHKRFYREIAAV